MLFDMQHHHKIYKKMLFKWFGPFIIRKVFTNNEFYEFKKIHVSPYTYCNNDDKLKNDLNIWIQGQNP